MVGVVDYHHNAVGIGYAEIDIYAVLRNKVDEPSAEGGRLFAEVGKSADKILHLTFGVG